MACKTMKNSNFSCFLLKYSQKVVHNYLIFLVSDQRIYYDQIKIEIINILAKWAVKLYFGAQKTIVLGRFV